jgi:hypothetical protein
MKKYYYITISMLLFFAKVIIAQEMVPEDTKTEKSESVFHNGIFGVRYMPSISSIKVQNIDGNVNGDFVLGYGVGGLIGFNFNKHVGLQVEAIYNQLSQKYNDHDLERRVDINYINVPLLLSLNTNRMKEVNLNVVIGPQLGVNVASKLTSTGTYNGNSNIQAVLAVKKNDFGIVYGAGLDFGLNHMQTIRLDVGFRGVMGLVDVSDRSGTLETNSYYILRKAQIETYSGYVGLAFLF